MTATTSPAAPFSPLVHLSRFAIALAIGALLWMMQSVLPQFINPYWQQILILAGVNVMLAVSLNLINGVTGQFSLGHAGFMATGAYASAAFSYYIGEPRLALPSGIVFLIALLIGAGAAGLAGLLVGLPSLRLRGDYLAIVTLGFNQIIVSVIRNQDALGGATGFNRIPIYANFTWTFALVILCILSIRNLATSGFGREMRAVRDDEIAAEASGINTTRVKVVAFVVSAMWAGIAGAVQVHYLGSANPDSFEFTKSVEIVVMVVLGGLGSITGSALAGFGLRFLEAILTESRSFLWVVPLFALFCVAIAWNRGQTLNRAAFWRFAALAMVVTGAFLAFAYSNAAWLESNKGPLRYVLYAVILILLMLMRPQGLLGRGEWSLKRRRAPLSKNAPGLS